MRRWLCCCALFAACSTSVDAERAAQRALTSLWAHQGPDGAVRSDVHGVLRPGNSLTAFALLATALLPARLRAPCAGQIEAAFAFLERATDQDGAIGLGGDGVDYPCYTSAHCLHALALLQPAGSAARIAQQIARLRALQLDEQEGWRATDFAYGAFGFGVRSEPRPLGAELVDIANVAAVLAALRAAGVPPTDPVFARARQFVARCQRLPGDRDPTGDGGFCYTPEPDFRASKAGFEVVAGGRELPRTYGTTTCDGIRALAACGAGPDDPARQAATGWLRARLDFERVPGLPADAVPPVEPALRLYWWASLGRTLQECRWPGDWREQLAAAVVRWQREDGGFVGFSDRMKEDDPVVATCLALLALASVLE
jgi:hypothetical protein